MHTRFTDGTSATTARANRTGLSIYILAPTPTSYDDLPWRQASTKRRKRRTMGGASAHLLGDAARLVPAFRQSHKRPQAAGFGDAVRALMTRVLENLLVVLAHAADARARLRLPGLGINNWVA